MDDFTPEDRNTFMAMAAALIGSVLSLSALRDITAKEAFFTIVAGLALTYFVGPWLMVKFELGNKGFAALSFMVGLLGMNFVAAALRFGQLWRDDPAKAIVYLLQLVGRGAPKP